VIDFVFANVNIQDKVLELRVEERVDSHHMPVCLELKPEKKRKKRRKKERETLQHGEERNIICWDTEARKKYWKKTEEKG